MDAEHEQHALSSVRERLGEQFPDVDSALIEAAVQLSHAELSESPIRDFVPLLVEHAARDRLTFARRDPDPHKATPHSPPANPPDAPGQRSIPQHGNRADSWG